MATQSVFRALAFRISWQHGFSKLLKIIMLSGNVGEQVAWWSTSSYDHMISWSNEHMMNQAPYNPMIIWWSYELHITTRSYDHIITWAEADMIIVYGIMSFQVKFTFRPCRRPDIFSETSKLAFGSLGIRLCKFPVSLGSPDDMHRKNCAAEHVIWRRVACKTE